MDEESQNRHKVINMLRHYWDQKRLISNEMMAKCLQILSDDRNPFLNNEIIEHMETNAGEGYELKSDVFTIKLPNDKKNKNIIQRVTATNYPSEIEGTSIVELRPEISEILDTNEKPKKVPRYKTESELYNFVCDFRDNGISGGEKAILNALIKLSPGYRWRLYMCLYDFIDHFLF